MGACLHMLCYSPKVTAFGLSLHLMFIQATELQASLEHSALTSLLKFSVSVC